LLLVAGATILFTMTRTPIAVGWLAKGVKIQRRRRREKKKNTEKANRDSDRTPRNSSPSREGGVRMGSTVVVRDGGRFP
jgi:hypothetical protein